MIKDTLKTYKTIFSNGLDFIYYTYICTYTYVKFRHIQDLDFTVPQTSLYPYLLSFYLDIMSEPGYGARYVDIEIIGKEN